MYQRQKRITRRDGSIENKNLALTKTSAKNQSQPKNSAKKQSQSKNSAQTKTRTKPKCTVILPELVADVFKLIISNCSPVGEIKMRSTCKLFHALMPEALARMRKFMEGDDVHKYFEGTFVCELITNLPTSNNNLEVFCGNRYIDLCPLIKCKKFKHLTKKFNGIPISLLTVKKLSNFKYCCLPMRLEKYISIGYTENRDNNYYIAVIDLVKNSEIICMGPAIMNDRHITHSAHIYNIQTRLLIDGNYTSFWTQSDILPEKEDDERIYSTTVLTGPLYFNFF